MESRRGRSRPPTLRPRRLRNPKAQRRPSTNPRHQLHAPAQEGTQDMFERFTERARQVVVLAQEEARTLKHNYIGTEHILLGLLREEEGLAARWLESLALTLEP